MYILTGHSLGGAVAQIIGLWLEDDAYEVQIYTFLGHTAVITKQLWTDGHSESILKTILFHFFHLTLMFIGVSE